jgi:hypothetical protein
MLGTEMSWYPGKILKNLESHSAGGSVTIESLEGLESPADVYREVSRLKTVLEKVGYVTVNVFDLRARPPGEARVHTLLSSGGVVYIVENTTQYPVRFRDYDVGPRGLVAFACALTP